MSVLPGGEKTRRARMAFVDPKKKSIFTYHKVLIFNYDVQCRKPFHSYARSEFSEEDIDPSWFTGPLTPANRRKILPLKPLGGGSFSVFAKIELGELSLVSCLKIYIRQ